MTNTEKLTEFEKELKTLCAKYEVCIDLEDTADYSNDPQYSMIASCGFSEKNLGNWVSSNK
jgi:hypothetical protein